MSETSNPPAQSSPPGLPEIHPVVSAPSDFSDRISPMIVKELRQGLRTRAFTGTFLVLQVVLGLSMFFALLGDSSDTGRLISSMVFLLFSIVALILQPLRGVSAVATELKDDTLEIMSLTRLSASRIVIGKWASIVSQTALMLAAVIPYLVMRYFFGGMQLFAELSLLFTVFILSACITGVTVGLSCNRLVLIRGLVTLVLVPGGLMMVSAFTFGGGNSELLEFFGFAETEMIVSLLVFLTISIYLGYYFLDMGVTRIAAAAENHSLRNRGISLGLMTVILIIMNSFDPAGAGSFIVMVIFSIAIGLDVCTESPPQVQSVVRPFVKRGPFVKMMGGFFYPGWHSGFKLLTVLLILTVVVGQLTFRKSFYSITDAGLTTVVLLFIVGVFYCILAPLFLVRIFQRKVKNLFTGYIGAIVGCLVMTVLVTLFAEINIMSEDATVYFFSWVPGVCFLMFEYGSDEVGLVLTLGFLTIVWFGLLLAVRDEFKKTRKLEKIAEDRLAAEKYAKAETEE